MNQQHFTNLKNLLKPGTKSPPSTAQLETTLKAQKHEKKRSLIKFLVALMISHSLVYAINDQGTSDSVAKTVSPSLPFSFENYSIINLSVNLIVALDSTQEWGETTLINLDSKETIGPCYIRPSGAQNKDGNWELGPDLSAHKGRDQTIYQVAIPRTAMPKILNNQNQVWDALPVLNEHELDQFLNRKQTKPAGPKGQYEIFY